MRGIPATLILVLSMATAWAAAPTQVVLDVENLTCPACRITIEKALDGVPGITGETVDLEAHAVTVIYDRDRTNPTAIAHALTEAGFPATVRASR